MESNIRLINELASTYLLPKGVNTLFDPPVNTELFAVPSIAKLTSEVELFNKADQLTALKYPVNSSQLVPVVKLPI